MSVFEEYRNHRIKYVKWLPFNVLAIVLFGRIFSVDRNLSDKLVNHELIHIHQQKKLGYFKFYFLYIKEFIKNYIRYKDRYKAYVNISFEKEAYRNASNLEYLDLAQFKTQ